MQVAELLRTEGREHEERRQLSTAAAAHRDARRALRVGGETECGACPPTTGRRRGGRPASDAEVHHGLWE